LVRLEEKSIRESGQRGNEFEPGLERKDWGKEKERADRNEV